MATDRETNLQRRLEDKHPDATIAWDRPGAPAVPQSSNAGATRQGGVTSLEGLTRYALTNDGELAESAKATVKCSGEVVYVSDVERLLAAPSQGEGVQNWLSYVDPECELDGDKKVSLVSGFVAGQVFNEICRLMGGRWPDAKMQEEAPKAYRFFTDLFGSIPPSTAPAPDARQSVNPQQSELSDEQIAAIGLMHNVQAFRNEEFRASQGSGLTKPEQEEYSRQLAFARAIEREVKAAQAASSAPTDLSKRLRAKSREPFGQEDFSLLTQAADEIERYYGGMMAWKQTAEAKDREFAASKAAPSAKAEPVAYLYEYISESGARQKGDIVARSIKEIGGHINLHANVWRNIGALYLAPAPAVQAEDVRNQALEEAAKLCEAQTGITEQEMKTAKGCAFAIRYIKKNPQAAADIRNELRRTPSTSQTSEGESA